MQSAYTINLKLEKTLNIEFGDSSNLETAQQKLAQKKRQKTVDHSLVLYYEDVLQISVKSRDL